MSTTSFLLRLPAELRNEVYFHVLSIPTPLRLVRSSFGRLMLTIDPDSCMLGEFNQLIYVNKYLHSEVANLNFNFKNIAVKSPERGQPVQLFLAWRAQLSMASKGWIGAVTLNWERSWKDEDNEDFTKQLRLPLGQDSDSRSV
jgi:hypothetical protein